MKGPMVSSSQFAVLLSAIVLVLCIHTSAGESFEVRMYHKVHMDGRYVKLKVSDKDTCINLPPLWAKSISSVDPMGCVLMYAEPDCKGLRRRLERWSWGSSNLRDISFENMISSISPCPAVKKIVIPKADEL